MASDRYALLFARKTADAHERYESQWKTIFRLCRPGVHAPDFDKDIAESKLGIWEMVSVGDFVFAGPYFAWKLYAGRREGEPSGGYVGVVNVVTRSEDSVPIGYKETEENISEMALTPKGRLAWIRVVWGGGRNPAQICRVETRLLSNETSSKQAPTLLESSSTFTESSSPLAVSGLRFDGNETLHWLNGSTQHSFVFPP